MNQQKGDHPMENAEGSGQIGEEQVETGNNQQLQLQKNHVAEIKKRFQSNNNDTHPLKRTNIGK
jgi:hypothetical protein